jgi:putative membrane protein
MESWRIRTFQALILALTGFFLLERVWSGRILLYINQRYVLLILAAGIVLIALAQVVLQERKNRGLHEEGESHEHEQGGHSLSRANLAWLVLPLVLGVLVPARSLGTSSLGSRGITMTSPFSVQSSAGATALERPSVQRTVLDWIRAFHAETDPTALNGEMVDLIGFVYHDPRLVTGQFLVGRYTVACCIADATAIGITVNWSAAAGLRDNDWVRVQGKLSSGQLDGKAVPVIDADQVIPIPEPDQPYLFP